jgi:SAM-dependent methyltransferase
VLDVGAGVGHWGRLLLPYLSVEGTIVGIDREEEWVKEATRRASALGLESRVRYVRAEAESIPFPDSTFDVVTCQTLLIHVPDVQRVLREMCRVLKPEGLLCIAEPNNLAWTVADAKVVESDDYASIAAEVEFNLICQRGKFLLGRGHNSAGEIILGHLGELPLRDIKVYLSDKCFSYIPPYDTAEEQANLRQEEEWIERDFLVWSKTETREYFIAGGGLEREFDRRWAEAIRKKRSSLETMKAKKTYKAGGGILYLFSARKV